MRLLNTTMFICIGKMIVLLLCVSAVSFSADAYQTTSTFVPCAACNESVTIKTNPLWDFNHTQKDYYDATYAIDDPRGNGVDDSATRSYNCHGYAFKGSSGWVPSAANYKMSTACGTHSGCYKSDSSGDTPVWGNGSVHSSHKGPGWGYAGPEIQRYTGTLGVSVKADHTERIYGFNGDVWKKN